MLTCLNSHMRRFFMHTMWSSHIPQNILVLREGQTWGPGHKTMVYNTAEIGAATYNSKYQKGWQPKRPFVFFLLCCLWRGCIMWTPRRMLFVMQNLFSTKEMPKLWRLIRKVYHPAAYIRVEVMVANPLIQHNTPLLGGGGGGGGGDSEIARDYASARTRTVCIANGSLLTPHFISTLVSAIKTEPFSIAIDRSSDNGLEKTLQLFDVNRGMVITQFLGMYLTTGRQSRIVESIQLNEGDPTTREIPWANCVGAGVDNTALSVDESYLKHWEPAAYFMGCPCHIVHNIALIVSGSFTSLSIWCRRVDARQTIATSSYLDRGTKSQNWLSEYILFLMMRLFVRVVSILATRNAKIDISCSVCLGERDEVPGISLFIAIITR